MEIPKIVELATSINKVYTTSGSIALIDADFIVQEEPIIFAGLYYKGKTAYLFVISKDNFESSILTE